MIVLLVAATIMAYSFIGALCCFKAQAIASRTCNSGPKFHWERNSWHSWCGHSSISFWVMGILWPIGLPAAAGMALGKSSSATRTERRRTKEIAEANHKVQLAKIRAEETRHLEKALEK